MKETFGKSKDEMIESKPTSTNNIYSKEESETRVSEEDKKWIKAINEDVTLTDEDKRKRVLSKLLAREKFHEPRTAPLNNEIKEENSLIKRNYINTNNNKVSADLLEYRDFIVFNEYTIGQEVYGASMNEEFHKQIKIQNEDIGKFSYDLILKFLNESTKHENYLTPSISLYGLCREYSIKFEEKYEKLKELTDKDSYDENIYKN